MAVSVLRPHTQKIKVPSPTDKIYKEECVLSFDTPESDTGLFVCMNTFLGFGRKHVEHYYHKTGNAVFLHIKRLKKEIKQEKPVVEKKPTRLAIGLEGGFNVNEGKKYEYEEVLSIILLPDFYEIPLPSPDLPETVQLSIATILAADAASKVEEALALAGTWDGEKRKVTKHADTLLQLDNGVKIPPSGWKCEMCDLTENLWLNLTDGSIHCGRKFFDGSGGNNHAVEHFRKTGYPLVVKLGTITSETSDVYSYDEDDMVEDPNLDTHLAHFGINVAVLEKTDKSMVELEIDMNQRVGEWAIIQEAGSPLTPVYGAGYTGLTNLGNSCYLNSVMQVMFAVPDFQKVYFAKAQDFFQNLPPDPTKDFNIQMAKLATGLLSGEYSKQPTDDSGGESADESQPGIKPHMFKSLIGQGHPEFSTKRQQDAQEFFLHLISVIERHSRGQENPADALKFQVEERIQCAQSGKVKYNTRIDYVLSLPIPLEAAINKDDVRAFEAKKAEKLSRGDRIDPNEIVCPRIPLQACLESFAATEVVDDFYSTALRGKSSAFKTLRMHTFPDYLMLQLKKFTIGDDWVPKKLDVSIDVPDMLHLEALRGKGLQPGEEELPDSAPMDTSENAFVYDEGVLAQLTDMGFPVDGCMKALYNTQNGGIDAAMNWIMEHMNDPDFSDPFVIPGTKRQNVAFSPSPEATAMIVSMGFSPSQANKALEATDNNVERAVDWIFSHADELDAASATSVNEAPPLPQFKDGPETYELVAFISHMGTSTVVGHYVCHILKEGRWVIYNDNKVALSEHPPKDLAYMYLYQRKSS